MAEYGTSVDTTASPDKVWKIWSDMSTWGDWNPNVSTMDWQGGFASGTTGVMNTRAGQHHKMRLVDVVPGRSFALETSVVPLTMFSRLTSSTRTKSTPSRCTPSGVGWPDASARASMRN